jgi:hypothetical protein
MSVCKDLIPLLVHNGDFGQIEQELKFAAKMQLISTTLFTTIALVGMTMAGTLHRPSEMSGLVRREIFRGVSLNL